MKLSESDVVHVATLAGLSLSPREVERMAGEISGILDYIEALASVRTPEGHGDDPGPPTCLAPDLVAPSLSPDRALENAPDRSGQFFQVPRILEEGR